MPVNSTVLYGWTSSNQPIRSDSADGPDMQPFGGYLEAG